MASRFTARKEFFGSLVYDSSRCDYIPFDWDATFIFEAGQQFTADEVFARMDGKLSQQSFQTFVQLCQSIDLLDKDGRFQGAFASGEPVPNVLAAPLRVHLEVTQRCELRCRHCSQDSRDAVSDELNLDEIKKLLDEMAEMGVMEVVLGGGDPFLRDDLYSIIAHARQKGICVSISTTAIFLSRVLAKKIAELGVKSFRISFDGSTEKSYDYFRGKGTYRRAVRGIKTLRELFEKTPITLHTVLMKPNLSELLTFVRCVQKMRANAWSIDFFRAMGTGAAESAKLALSIEEVKETFHTLQRIQENTSVKIEVPHFPWRSQRKGIYRNFGCAGGNLYCHIDSRGDVYPCSFLKREFKGGSIRTESLKSIWLNSAAFRKFRSLPGNDVCRQCEYFSSCRGGCRARAAAGENANSVDPYCFVQEREKAQPRILK
jgi:radical SAM protein with 4Fe4S-binding SPASM domain